IRQHALDPKGRPYFSLTREGQPCFYQRKPYGAVFYALALLEYSKSTGDASLRREAVEMFDRIAAWIDDATLMDRPRLAGQRPTSALANVMVLASLAYEFAEVDDDPRWRDVMKRVCRDVRVHFDPERRILLENVCPDGTDLTDWPEGRFFSPGHSVETAWFILQLAGHVPDAEVERLALDAIAGSLEFGWDREFGGLYNFMDVEGKPTLQLEGSMKLWWPQTEAIYALLVAYARTKDDRWLDWLERVDRYAFQHFADNAFGGWFGYCDRQGNLTHTLKGGNYKGFFHVPRFLLMSVQLIEEMES
ncbi:MAG TPA: AGE family epimerase/isomerase, partial [Planctomycetota bacterium]|nr:AGE family epimerase/isomerase [Planctomycetota bacterium]